MYCMVCNKEIKSDYYWLTLANERKALCHKECVPEISEVVFAKSIVNVKPLNVKKYDAKSNVKNVSGVIEDNIIGDIDE